MHTQDVNRALPRSRLRHTRRRHILSSPRNRIPARHTLRHRTRLKHMRRGRHASSTQSLPLLLRPTHANQLRALLRRRERQNNTHGDRSQHCLSIVSMQESN